MSAQVKRRFGAIDAALVAVPGAQAQAATARLRGNPHVRYVEPNGTVHADATLPNDPGFGNLWGLDNTGQVVEFAPGTPGDDIGAPAAWSVTTGSRNIVVAVVDSGVDYTHPDLAANIWTNSGEACAGCKSNGSDDDGNGFVDDWHGWNFVAGNNDPADDNGHGTHVAGTIGAVGNNGVGITGVAWNVSLMPLKVLDANGSGDLANAVSAILYATANGAKVINASWGTTDYSQALFDAVAAADRAGVLLVAAAGNNLTNNDTTPNYPSSLDLPNVISVAATDNQDDPAWFSNYGAASVDLSAPGVGIDSTWPGGSYQVLDGTSMAAPHVTGTAALIESEFPGATAVGTKSLLLRTVDPVAGLSGLSATGGRLDAARSVGCTVDPELWVDAPRGAISVFDGDAVQLSILAASCADPAGVSVTAVANGAPLTLAPRGDGLYSGTFVASGSGATTITVTAANGAGTDTKTIPVSISPSSTIVPGGPPVTVTTTVPGQIARLSFTGAAGQRVSLALGAGSMGLEKVTLLAPDGSTIVSQTFTNSGFLDVRTLPSAGTYSVLVDPNGTNVGSLTVTLYDVPPDVVATITPGGAPATVTTSVPGQNARLSFGGSPGQRVSVALGAGSMSSEKVTLLAPDGSTIVSQTFTNSGFLDVRTLPSDGAYALLVDPGNANVGSLTLTLYAVPPDTTATIAPGGPPVTITTTAPGQNARLSFSGVAAERVSVALGAGSMSTEKLTLLAPDGATVVSQSFANNGFLDVRTLPSNGTYGLLVDPSNGNVGSLTVTLFNVPPDPTATITPGGPPVTVTTTVPGQNARLTFSGAAAQRVSLVLTAGSMGSENVSLLAPDGSTVVLQGFANTGFLDVRTLPSSGTYALLVDPNGGNVGSVTLTLDDVPPDTIGTITPGGPPATVTTSVPGQNARLTFTGAAGQRISLAISAGSMSTEKVTLLAPDGSTVAAQTFANTGFLDVRTLPSSGAYALLVDPNGGNVGSVTLTLYDVPPDTTAAITPGGPPVTVTTTAPGQNARLTFTGAAGTQLTVKLSGVTMSNAWVTILKPDGTTLVGPKGFGTGGTTFAFTPTAGGVYTIVVDPQGTAVGSTTLALT